MDDLFRKAMSGIGEKVALQEIRKVLRGKDKESVKLEKVITIIHSYEEDEEMARFAAERRELEAEEAAMNGQKIQNMFDTMAEPLEKLTVKGDG